KSKPKLRSRASMRVQYLPPTRRSFVACGQCQSGEAKFQWIMWAGSVQYDQQVATGAATRACTVIFSLFIVVVFICCCIYFRLEGSACMTSHWCPSGSAKES